MKSKVFIFTTLFKIDASNSSTQKLIERINLQEVDSRDTNVSAHNESNEQLYKGIEYMFLISYLYFGYSH